MPGKARWHAALEAVEALVTQTADGIGAYQDDRSAEWIEGYAAEEYKHREKQLKKIAEQLTEILILW